MLTVAPPAAEKLREAIEAEITDPQVCIRLVASAIDQNQLEMMLDKARE